MPRCPSCHQEFLYECRNDRCPNLISTFASDAPLLPQGVCVSCSGTTYTPVEDRPEKGFVAGKLVCTNNLCLLSPSQLKRAPVLWMFFCIMGGPFLTRTAIEHLYLSLLGTPAVDLAANSCDLGPYFFRAIETLREEAQKDERLRFPLASDLNQLWLPYQLAMKRTSEDRARKLSPGLWFVSGIFRYHCRLTPRDLFAIRVLYGAWIRLRAPDPASPDTFLKDEIGNDALRCSQQLYRELNRGNAPHLDDIERLAVECLSALPHQDPHSYERRRMDPLVAWFKAQLDQAEQSGSLPVH